MNPHVRKNRELWDEWTEINVRSAFYDVAGWKATGRGLDPEVREALGDLTGASVLHLQCHFGLDTLRLAQLAAHVTGVDLSPRAIAHARALSAETGITARFIESDVYALPEVLGERFDVVFSSYGAIEWLPDLGRWAELVARYLKPGGRLVLVEGHPTMWMFDSDHPTELRVATTYFHGPQPIEILPTVGNYADPTAVVTAPAYSWIHDLAEIVTAVLGANLRLTALREYAHIVWKAFPFLVETAPGRWEQPPEQPRIPLMFALVATRPK
ncbi:MAG: class I SAM-dependent methyltransferase [Deltaproteobacteria bacterium]|nr:class I SAM-dependent methyltransferase [Deltaproteobacteria bacterium]